MSTEPIEPLIDDATPDTQRDPETGNGSGTGNARPASHASANAHAGPRTRTQGATPAKVPDEPARTATLGERLTDLAKWLVEVFEPPEIWSDDRPSLAKVAARAKRGEWTKADGAVRTAGVAYYRFVYVPTAATCRYVDWLVEHPSRLIVALAVLGLIVAAIWSYL